MVCKGVQVSELEAVAAQVGVRLNGLQASESRKWGAVVRFTLRPIEGKFQRYNQLHYERTRKVNAVCYHGHCAFLDLLFDRFPAARVESASATYEGRDDYAEERGAADVWEGNDHWGRVRYSAQCRCADEEQATRERARAG